MAFPSDSDVPCHAALRISKHQAASIALSNTVARQRLIGDHRLLVGNDDSDVDFENVSIQYYALAEVCVVSR